MTAVSDFMKLLRQGCSELFADHPGRMDSGELIPSPNVIDPQDVELFFAGVEAELITVHRGARFNTRDRPARGGHWGLLSRGRAGGGYNAEYLPQLAAYVEAILEYGYPQERVLFELPFSALQLDIANTCLRHRRIRPSSWLPRVASKSRLYVFVRAHHVRATAW